MDEETIPVTAQVVRAKWTIDGATTLDEAAAKLEAFAAQLRALEAAGWQLTDPVADDYGFIDRSG